MRSQYAAGTGAVVPAGVVGEEECGCCGAAGSILMCARGHIVCRGLSTSTYMRCYWGFQGPLRTGYFEQPAISPRMMP